MLNNEERLRILTDWNSWDSDFETGVPRVALETALAFHKGREVVVIKGVRRSGKTTLMRQIMKALFGSGVQSPKALYINFEDPRLLDELEVGVFDRIIEAYREKINPRGKTVLFLDEVQNVPGWEAWVRTAFEIRREVKIFISGSNASLLSGEFATKLSGRNLPLSLFPFSFSEFLSARDFTIDSMEMLPVSRREELLHHLREYLEWGGFPEVVCGDRESRLQRLQAYYADILYRDVAERHHIREVRLLKQVAHAGISLCASECNLSRMADSLSASRDTIRAYFSHLQDAYLIFQLPFFSFSLRESNRRHYKVYCIDNGLRNVSAHIFSADFGRLLENAVFLALQRSGMALYYWKGKNEVDFVLHSPSVTIPCNVVASKEVPEREFAGLREFMAVQGVKRGILVSMGSSRTHSFPEGEVVEVFAIKLLYEGIGRVIAREKGKEKE